MQRQLISAALAVIVFTVLLGLAYPLAITGISQVAFTHAADGSQITRDGKVVGSSLTGQDFSKPVLGKDGKPAKDSDGNAVTEPDPRYFQERPSVTGYNPAGTYFSNRGPNSAVAAYAYRDNVRAYLDLERPYTPGLTAGKIPVDGVTTSASGVDPHISPATARLQVARVARERGAANTPLLDALFAVIWEGASPRDTARRVALSDR